MQDKIGLPLDQIHLTGNVPQCAFVGPFCYCICSLSSSRTSGAVAGITLAVLLGSDLFFLLCAICVVFHTHTHENTPGHHAEAAVSPLPPVSSKTGSQAVWGI